MCVLNLQIVRFEDFTKIEAENKRTIGVREAYLKRTLRVPEASEKAGNKRSRSAQERLGRLVRHVGRLPARAAAKLAKEYALIL